ncbi:arginine--tRNA ligase [Lacticigenium naphthae]|uniref:arginine--tRNA ligase n=1 Tax=Lacticigenium naphthae TaxID=515351 RepID=UPI00042A4C98|nr:arginine--tRNA ligase [Lacticigenium naphthae]
MDYKKPVAQALHETLKEDLSYDEIYSLLEKPKMAAHGDLAFPTFSLAKLYRKSPAQIAGDLKESVTAPIIKDSETVGPYLNFFLDKTLISREVLNEVLDQKDKYGSHTIGENKNVPVDMSSPNIAKPMSLGHLRSTVIGNSLSEIFTKMGYNTIKINHIGDWGTQFGKLIVAYKRWGHEEEVRANPISELLRLYVKFHAEAETDIELENEGRLWFRKLEEGNEEAWELWTWFREESLKEFKKIYTRLNISFDSYSGEAFYNDKMDKVIDLLEEKNLLSVNRGAHIVDLDKYNLNPALIKKSDGATLYITRDLAAAFYRKENYNFAHSLYVVGQEQSNHFNQLKAVLKEMGYDWADDIHHIPFGLITQGGRKLSTRKGQVVLLEEVLNEAVEQAKKQINEKNPEIENKDEIAEQVGVGAVVFHDLKNDRLNSFDFTIEEVVQFEGETGPYVQYTRARGMSILRKAGQMTFDPADTYSLTDEYSWDVIKLIQEMPEAVMRAYNKFEPSVIAKHAISLAQAFNRFYANVRVLDEHEEKNSRLALVYAVTEVIKEDLRLLGVQSPNQM